MKKKPTAVRRSFSEGGSQLRHRVVSTRNHSVSAFVNLRVLIGLFVMLAGVFLALVSFGPATTGFAQETTREQMTLALAQALAINPPACVAGQEMFNDVPASSPFCPWIEELSRRGITGGCAPGLFCPGDPVTRQQMAVFIVRAMDAVRPTFGQIRSDGSIKSSSPDLVGVIHPATGVYCLQISPQPSRKTSESVVASVHADNLPGLAAACGGVGNECGCPFGTVPIQTTDTIGTPSNKRFTFMVPR
jgi:hypothetical protein